jgi:hypothetical protein
MPHIIAMSDNPPRGPAEVPEERPQETPQPPADPGVERPPIEVPARPPGKIDHRRVGGCYFGFRRAAAIGRFVSDGQHNPSTKTSTRRSTLACQPGWSCM